MTSEFEPWDVNLEPQYQTAKVRIPHCVMGYRHKKSKTDLLLVYETPGYKRLGQRMKDKFNFTTHDDPKPKDNKLLFVPIKFTKPDILQKPIFSPIKEFLKSVPFSTDPRKYKAEGEHLSFYFKVFVADFGNERLREDYMNGLKSGTWI